VSTDNVVNLEHQKAGTMSNRVRWTLLCTIAITTHFAVSSLLASILRQSSRTLL
jgi:hypothetical protein